MGVAVEDVVADPQEGDEEGKDEEVLEAEEALVDDHGESVAAEADEHHEDEETEDAEGHPIYRRGAHAVELAGSINRYPPPELSGHPIQSKYSMKEWKSLR